MCFNTILPITSSDRPPSGDTHLVKICSEFIGLTALWSYKVFHYASDQCCLRVLRLLIKKFKFVGAKIGSSATSSFGCRRKTGAQLGIVGIRVGSGRIVKGILKNCMV